MFRSWAYLRWGILLASLAVEGLEFWFLDPGNRFSAYTIKWMGLTALSFFFVALECCFLYRNKSRAKSELDGKEYIEYDTGHHWAVLARNIHAHKASRRGIWWPVRIAALVTLFYAGLVIWYIVSFPALLPKWFVDPMHTLLDGNASRVLEILAVGWVAMFVLRHLAAWLSGFRAARALKLRFAASLLLWLMRADLLLIFLAALFGGELDWLKSLGTLYTILPDNGYLAGFYLPLIVSIFFVIPQVTEWRSQRYFLAVDADSHQARLIITDGVFSYEADEINLARIVEAGTSKMGVWRRLIRRGDVILHEQSGSGEKRLADIWDPIQLKRQIHICIKSTGSSGH